MTSFPLFTEILAMAVAAVCGLLVLQEVRTCRRPDGRPGRVSRGRHALRGGLR
jgi:hypothetical protein